MIPRMYAAMSMLISSSHRCGNDSKVPNASRLWKAVHPTGVGMIRNPGRSGETWDGSSHRCGNDSPLPVSVIIVGSFIPQVWE